MSATLKTATNVIEATLRQPQNLMQSVAEAIYEASLRRALKGIDGKHKLAA